MLAALSSSTAGGDDDDQEPLGEACECTLAPFPVVVLASHDTKYENTLQCVERRGGGGK